MKRTYPLLLMLLFGLTAVWTSVQSFRITQREIANQLTEALLLTQAEMPGDWLSTDTIQQFRGHIRQPELREAASLAFYTGDADDPNAGLRSRALAVSPSLRARAFLTYSSFQVWRMSDQRLSLFLSLLMLTCMGLSLFRVPSRGVAVPPQPTGLTPMQEQLVGLLMSAPDRTISKQQLCQALWPGKPDASETLYTLVRRTKQALAVSGAYRIESDRGRSYRIESV